MVKKLLVFFFLSLSVFSGDRHFDKVIMYRKDTTTTPYTVAVFDSANDTVKQCLISTISPDSVSYSDSSGYADTAGIARNFTNNVATNYYAFKKADGTFDDSLLWINEINGLYFGYTSTTNPTFTLFNNSGSAGSSSQLRLYNLQTVFGGYSGYPTLVSTKISAGSYAGYNKISLRTVSDPSPYTYIDHWAVYEETGQLVLNDSLFTDIQSYPTRTTWYPVLVKHAATVDSTGLKINGKIKALCKTSSSDSVIVQNADSSFGIRDISVSEVDSGYIPLSLGGIQRTESSATDTGNTFRIREDLECDSSIYLTSTTSSKLGVMYKSGSRFLHDFHHPVGGGAVPTGINLFIGLGSGNFTSGSTATTTTQSSLNLGIGAYTLPALTLGYMNTCLGPYSGNKITEGAYCLGAGPYTLYSATTANYLLAFGYRALYLATTAQFDNATGASTLYSCVDCSYCNAYGTNALNALVHGNFNDAFGYRSLFYMLDSSYVSAFGYFSGTYYGSGTDNLTYASRSLFLGPLTRAGGNNQSNQTVIGYNVVGQGSNTTTIGNTSVVASYIRGDIILDSDDKYMKFGASQDATIGYESDGDVHYNSQAVGSGRHIFEGGDVFVPSLRQSSTWHAVGGFRDSSVTITISGADTWAMVTNASGSLWGGEEFDGISLSGDTMTIDSSGHFVGTVTLCYSALTGKDYTARARNVTQNDSTNVINGPSTSGANNKDCVTIPIYFHNTAGDEYIFEIQCDTDASDVTVHSARFELSYLHD